MDKLTDEIYQTIDQSADKLHLALKINLTQKLVNSGCAELALTVAMLASGNYFLGLERTKLMRVDIACLEASSFSRVDDKIIMDADVLDHIRCYPDEWHEKIMVLEAENELIESQALNVRSIYVNNYSQKVLFGKGNYISIYRAFNMSDKEKKHFNELIACLMNLLDS